MICFDWAMQKSNIENHSTQFLHHVSFCGSGRDIINQQV